MQGQEEHSSWQLLCQIKDNATNVVVDDPILVKAAVPVTDAMLVRRKWFRLNDKSLFRHKPKARALCTIINIVYIISQGD